MPRLLPGDLPTLYARLPDRGRCCADPARPHLAWVVRHRSAAEPAFPGGAVAQWSEQGTHNPSVAGSIPACPTSSEAIFDVTLATAATAMGTTGTTISRLERGIQHNSELAQRYEEWLKTAS